MHHLPNFKSLSYFLHRSSAPGFQIRFLFPLTFVAWKLRTAAAGTSDSNPLVRDRTQTQRPQDPKQAFEAVWD